MEYFNNVLCVEAAWLYGEGDIMTQSNYKALKSRGALQVARRACKNNPALVEFDSLPARFKKLVRFKVGDPYKATRFKMFTDLIEPDPNARAFFASFKLADGRNLKPETQREYTVNAELLTACGKYAKNRKAVTRTKGGTAGNIWDTLANIIEQIKEQYKHALPSNPRRLYDKFRKYNKEGYTALISGKFLNNNSRKVDNQIEQLILSLACLPEKPYNTTVNDLYLQFLGGAIEVADMSTGEIFNPDEFKDKNGVPVVLSDSTVWNYLNMPKNRVIIDQLRNDSKYYNDHHRPHHHRLSPMFSLSKISLDDRDLPRKMHDGNRVKAYYAYDVASGAVVGASYSRNKNTALFVACVRDMFQTIERLGLNQPAEVEVEHHIVNQFANDMMRAEMLFQHVRWCAPGNSQEKRAEHFNRAKKYGYEKRYQQGIGRHTAKLEANRPKQVGEWNENGMRIKEQTYSFDELVADDRATIEKYNNDLHPDQKKYRGLTRLQVLVEKQNPKLKPIDKSLVYRFIGNETKTSIRRNQYVRVNHENYILSSPDIIDQLEPNNREVVAYWLPNADGDVNEVYIYQNGLLIDTCKHLDRYNEAAIERTGKDWGAIKKQAAFVKQFDEKAKAGKANLHKIEILKPADPEQYHAEAVDETPATETPADDTTGFENNDDFYNDNALNSL